MNKEIWLPIKDYENYEISNLGRVRKNNKILRQYENDKGYLYVGLSKNNKRKFFRVHRLVAMAFINNSENLPEVNHKDENKLNNRIDNLEWCTRLYNMRYGNAQEKATKTRYKKINQYDLSGNLIKTWNSIKEATETLKNTHIRDVLKGRRKTASNSYWTYCDK